MQIRDLAGFDCAVAGHIIDEVRAIKPCWQSLQREQVVCSRLGFVSLNCNSDALRVVGFVALCYLV